MCYNKNKNRNRKHQSLKLCQMLFTLKAKHESGLSVAHFRYTCRLWENLWVWKLTGLSYLWSQVYTDLGAQSGCHKYL